MTFPEYPAYKDSGVEWLGEVPAHWEVKKIAHGFSRIGSGTTPPSNEPKWYEGGSIPWITTSELRENLILETKKYITDEALSELTSLQVHPPGSLAIAMYGATIGRLGIFGVSATTNQACCVLSGSKSIGSKFAFYWLLAFKDVIISLYATGGGQPNINQETIANLRIPAPSLADQAKIASFLDRETSRIDALVEQQQRLIELLKEKRQAVISHAVTKGLDPDVPMKDSGVEWLGEVPAHWEVRKASYIGRLFGSDNVPEDMISDEGDTPYLKVGSLSTDSLEVADWGWYIDPSISGAYRACGHYVVFPKRGAAIFLNKVNVVSRPALIDPNLMGWEIEGYHSTWYFAYSLKLRKLDELADVSTVPQINNKHISPERFPVPPIEEQEEIVSYLKQRLGGIDELVATSESGVKLLQERRSALISAAVTGKIDVRGWQPPAGSLAATEAMQPEAV